MSSLDEHPTAKLWEERKRAGALPVSPSRLDAAWLRDLCLKAGADDVGFVEIDRPEIGDQRADILHVFPAAKALISFVVNMNREPIRSPARSVANLEFHHAGDEVNEVGRRVVAALQERGVTALNPSMGFPMEMARFPGKIWVVAHKPVAEAAGLGRMGIHRNVIHPKRGSFVLLGTVLVGAEISEYSRPLEYDPCLSCKLCVAACPVGAIGPDGYFNFSSCYTHNYREFMSGFTDWVESVAESRSAREYREKVSDPESVSLWQSLSFGPNYKAAYCVAVCPAGEDVIGPFLTDRKGFLENVVNPLQSKEEIVYAVPGSDAEEHVARRFPHKTLKRVANGIRPLTIRQFLDGLRLAFQRNRSEGLDAIFHFTFTGEEEGRATVVIRNRTLDVRDEHHGAPDLRVTADSRTWLDFVARQRSLVWALLRRKIRIRGSPKLLVAFGRCFPS